LQEDGSVRIVGHDSGPGVSRFFGPDVTSYEWTYLVTADRVPALIEVLGGSPDADVLRLLVEYHRRTDGVISALLRDDPVNAAFSNWHG
jgi:hypothetical protein